MYVCMYICTHTYILQDYSRVSLSSSVHRHGRLDMNQHIHVQDIADLRVYMSRTCVYM